MESRALDVAVSFFSEMIFNIPLSLLSFFCVVWGLQRVLK